MLSILVFLPLGAILEGVPAVILLTPIMLPIAEASASTRCTTER